MTTQETLRAPVAFFIFNRPETTKQVFDRIARARPQRLFVVADGPRAGRVADEELCRRARSVAEGVDWNCEVLRDYADTNLGCKRRVATGIDWVFRNTEEAIILEDDCVPARSFFRFCDDMLARFRDDRVVAMVSGTNYFPETCERDDRYLFSRHYPIWGWATWRRAWAEYSVDISRWRDDLGWEDLCRHFGDPRVASRFSTWFDYVSRGFSDTWDYQWTLSCIRNHRLCVVPSRNLITNIGSVGVHARGKDQNHERAASEMSFPVGGPAEHVACHSYDALMNARIPPNTIKDFLALKVVRSPALYRRLKWMLGR